MLISHLPHLKNVFFTLLVIVSTMFYFQVHLVDALQANTYSQSNVFEDQRYPTQLDGRNGEFVVAGHFKGKLNIGQSKVCNKVFCYSKSKNVIQSSGFADIYLSKYDKARNLIWTRTAGGVGDDRGRSVITDWDGNIVLTGYTSGQATFSNTASIAAPTVMSRVLFLSKYSQAGDLLWVNPVGNCIIGKCDVWSVSVDQSGIIITGPFVHNITLGIKETCSPKDKNVCFSTGITTLTSAGTCSIITTGSGVVCTYDCYVAKFDYNGAFVWSRNCADSQSSTLEQRSWQQKALTFIANPPPDPSGLIGRDMNFSEYTKRKLPPVLVDDTFISK